METSVKEQLMGIHSQLSSLIADPRLRKVAIRPGGPGHPDGGVCRLADDILSYEDFFGAINKIQRWLGYIIEVMEPHL